MENNTTTRIKQLSEKLYYIENEYVRSKLSDWAAGAEQFVAVRYEQYKTNVGHLTEKGYALKYMLNHICPNLQHRKPRPDPNLLAMGGIYLLHYNRQQHEYDTENTQAAIGAWDKYPAQAGICDTDEEYDILMEAASPFIGVQCFVYQDGAGTQGNLPYATVYAKSADEAKETLLGFDTPLLSLEQWAKANHWPSLKYKPNKVLYRDPKTGEPAVLRP